MRVGKYEVFWHLPLVSYLDRETRKPKLLDDAPLGYQELLPLVHEALPSRPFVLLGESFRAFHAAGIALILAGVTLAGALRPARARG